MADCTDLISASITSTCVQDNAYGGGNEKKAWLVPRSKITFTPDATNPSKLTGFTIAAGGSQLFTLETVDRDIDAGHDKLGVEAGQPTQRFTHFASFKVRDNSVVAVENASNLDDLVLITEIIGKGVDATAADGVFEVRGVARGLYATADTRRLNSENGARPVELTTAFDQYELYPHYTLQATDYDTTLALLVAAETPTS